MAYDVNINLGGEGITDEELQRINKFVAGVEWWEAVKYRKFCPHEYIVVSNVSNEYRKDYYWFIKFIREKGFTA